MINFIELFFKINLLKGMSLKMCAVVEISGKQYYVKSGDEIFVEKLDYSNGAEITIDKVVAVLEDKKQTFGEPYINRAKVLATVLKSGKQKKIRVFTYKRRQNIKRTIGHRQPYTKLKIGAINF